MPSPCKHGVRHALKWSTLQELIFREGSGSVSQPGPRHSDGQKGNSEGLCTRGFAPKRKPRLERKPIFKTPPNRMVIPVQMVVGIIPTELSSLRMLG